MSYLAIVLRLMWLLVSLLRMCRTRLLSKLLDYLSQKQLVELLRGLSIDSLMLPVRKKAVEAWREWVLDFLVQSLTD